MDKVHKDVKALLCTLSFHAEKRSYGTNGAKKGINRQLLRNNEQLLGNNLLMN
ncbi:hypothetical protein [Halobacillus mangrovi]|uniref:hypothetical protein n=1 Tax=Halobacillus mangrovi TaxID=402384 RepID=UPI003D971FCE